MNPRVVPWEAGDFLGTSSRDARIEEWRRDQIEAKREDLQAVLGKSEVPEWAVKADELHKRRMQGVKDGG